MKVNINLRDIKNIHNRKEIFEFLDKKLKQNIIIYNKELGLKKILDVKIEDYKEVSGKYIEGRRNRKGREYIIKTNALIFEGEYLNGKRNGRGKEYLGDLKFEGEYLNGKGKEYFNDLKFEGEYSNGRIWEGIGYNINGEKEFEIKNGKGYKKNIINMVIHYLEEII